MEYFTLIFLHVFLGIVWAGGAIVAGIFIIPAGRAGGPAGGAVVAGVARRKLPLVLTMAAALVVLTGVRLYMIRFTPAWLTSPEGIVLTLGGLLGLAAFVLGVFIQRPTAERLGALSADIAKSGAPPSASQNAELQALRQRLRKVASLTAWHLLGAAALMSAHRLATIP
jgi:uncharacterized membrane protein